MRRIAICLLCLALLGATALAEQWNKTYQVGSKPSLRVDTNDASIEVTRGGSNSISAQVLIDGYKQGDVRVTDRQSGDKVDLQVHLPNQYGIFLTPRRVRIQVQVPAETALDLHSGDGHINVDGTSGSAKVDTGDGAVSVRNLTGVLDAHTGDGHITADGVFTSLKLRTGDGRVELTARPGSKLEGSWSIETNDGSVEARLPGDLAAELYARTGDGHITLDLPLAVSGAMERNRVRGNMNGGGPLLEISTGDGSIHIGKD